LPAPSKSRPLGYLRSLWALRGIVRRHRIDLIHCNEQNVYPIARSLAWMSGLPVVASVHCAMNRGFSAWAFGGRPPTRLFFVSAANREACRPAVSGVVPEVNWRVLHNGIDVEHFRPDPARGAAFRSAHGLGDGPLIGVACALREWKQLEHLFDAARRARLPDVKVVVAGGAVPWEPQGYAEKVLAEGRAKLGDRFVPLGHQTDLRGFYNAIDLFVNTSRQEAFGICPLESLACGCPVVGYPSEAVAEVVLPGGGEFVEQDRADLLGELIRSWVADRPRLAAAREPARRRAEAFDIRPLADRLWEEYRVVLGPGMRNREFAPASSGGQT
jgi:glycosyltransferase involved in cell wall biosynthesis